MIQVRFSDGNMQKMKIAISERTGLRATQEDVAVPLLRRWGAAVFDGHAGSSVSRMLGSAFTSSVAEPTSILRSVQRQVEKSRIQGGSTVTIASIDPSGRTAEIVWCGDGSCFSLTPSGIPRSTVVQQDLALAAFVDPAAFTTTTTRSLVNHPHSLPGTLVQRTTLEPIGDEADALFRLHKELAPFRSYKIENDDAQESFLKEFLLFLLYNGPERVQQCKDQLNCWIRPHGRGAAEMRAVIGSIEPTRSIGDVLYTASPIPEPTKQTWTLPKNTLGIVVTCDGFYSHNAFADPSSLAQFLLQPGSLWRNLGQVDTAEQECLEWIQSHPQRVAKYGANVASQWAAEIESCAEFVRTCFVNNVIDPQCTLLNNPQRVCDLATATAILNGSLDNCTIAWIPTPSP